MFYREYKISIILWSVFCSWQWNIHYSCFWPFCPEGGGKEEGCVGTKEPADCNIGVQIIAGTLSRISTLCTYFDQGFALPKIFFWQILGNQTSRFKMRPLVLWDILVSLKQQSFFLALINLSPQATPGNWKETEMCDVGFFPHIWRFFHFLKNFKEFLGNFILVFDPSVFVFFFLVVW